MRPDGVLLWYRHDGFNDGSFTWSGPNEIGTGWNGFRQVLGNGDGKVYAVAQDGTLLWYAHDGFRDGGGLTTWRGPQPVGTGWGDFLHLFAGGEGVLYAVAQDGSLLWYRHKGVADGSATWEGPKAVGGGWQDFTRVFSTGGGVVYGVTRTGDLLWYRHKGFADGGGLATWEGPLKVGSGRTRCRSSASSRRARHRRCADQPRHRQAAERRADRQRGEGVPQPKRSASSGSRWIAGRVSAKPRLVCTVSVVPTRPGGAASATLRRELRGIGDHRGAPDQAEQHGQPRAPRRRPRPPAGSRRRDRHGPDGQLRPADAGRRSSPPATQPTAPAAPMHREGGQARRGAPCVPAAAKLAAR